ALAVGAARAQAAGPALLVAAEPVLGDQAGVGAARDVLARRAREQPEVAEHRGAEVVTRLGCLEAARGLIEEHTRAAGAGGRGPAARGGTGAAPAPSRRGAPATTSAQESRRSRSPVASAAPKRSPATPLPAPGTSASVMVRGLWRPSRTTIPPAAPARSG